MSHDEWDAWEPEAPPRDFASQVVTEALRERRPKPNPRSVRVGAAVLLTLSVAAAAAFVVQVKTAHAHGDVTAKERQEVRVGTRALAVLEPGAHVTWDGDAIAQSGGDVFWRVEPGARFTVQTPAADVAVKGTCFRVKVEGEEGAMTGRDAKSGTIGAVLAATAFVGVYEGKVAVSHAGQSVDVVAGQSAQAGADGVRRVAGTGPDGQPVASSSEPATEGEKALTEANANLAGDVQRYRRRLEAIEGEKKQLESQLAKAQAKLPDGAVEKSEYDLSPQDWKDLAKEGELRTRVPCAGPRGDYSYSPDSLNALGLAPQDGPILQQAFQQSFARTWGVVQPLCSQALGGIDVTKVGANACMNILGDITRANSASTYDADLRAVTEIMAGLRPAPAPGATVDPYLAASLAMANESANVVSDLAKTLGPEQARHVVFAEVGCWNNTGQSFGPKPTP